MIRGGIVTLFIFFVLPFSVSADTVVYYSGGFESDQGWVTDQPANFFWNSASNTLSARIENTPPAYEPNRCFATSTSLDPNQNWRLEWDMYLESALRNGVYTFGLYSPDYIYRNRTKKNLPKITSESTANMALYTFNNNHNNFEYTIVSDTGNNLGVGGANGSGFFDQNVWYTASIEYRAASGTMQYKITEKNTGTVIDNRTVNFATPLTFSSNMQVLGISAYPEGHPGTTFDSASRLNGNSQYQIDNVTLTQVGVDEPEEPEPESEPLSDLLLQYEPVLYFHENEDYYPMNVEAYVEGSGLWDSTLIDENLIARGEGNGLTLEYLATTTDTSNWYINFSSDEAGDFDLAAAKARYKKLVESGKATSTYYALEKEDSYTDELGKTHEFIVLQYWYFYAMNNWDEQGGFNDHEGDWESVFIFLDKDTKEPLYAAFSAHHNDGADDITSTSVRRDWSDTNIFDFRTAVYVSLGSHAMYNSPGLYPNLTADDDATGIGSIWDEGLWKNRIKLSTTTNSWENKFKGQFGTEKFDFWDADSGPRGPMFSDVSGINRFEYPIEWAGIDKIIEFEVEDPVTTITSTAANVTMQFADALKRGDVVTVNPYEEFISFGLNVDEVDLFPRYYDFDTSLENETFEVEITLTYTDEELEALGLLESELVIWYFNEFNNVWKPVESEVDTVANTISFVTDHFSIYTIGTNPVVPETEPLDTKYRWGKHNEEEETRTAFVSFGNGTGGNLTEPVTLFVSDIEPGEVELLDYDEKISAGYYVTLSPEEYGKCFIDVTKSELPTDMKTSDKKRILESRPYKCNEMVSKHPELVGYQTIGLRGGEYSKFVPFKFMMEEKDKRFRFDISILEGFE